MNARLTNVCVLAFLLAYVTRVVGDDLIVDVAASAGFDGEKLKGIDELMSAEVKAGRIVGCLALVARGDKVAYLKTWGQRDRKRDQPMKHDTIFRIYSMTKPITSVAVMQLVEQGKLRLDDPVAKYLPELKDLEVIAGENGEKTVKAERRISVRDLLRHTSGMTYGFFGDSVADKAYRSAGVLVVDPTIEATVKKLGTLPLLYQPGTRWHYSVSTDVLGRLVEVVSKERFDRYLKQHIFDPLEMRDTFFMVPRGKQDRFAEMYRPATGSALTESLPLESIRFLMPANQLFSGGGGLCSTTGDYLRFCRALLNGGVLDGKRILKADTIARMTRNQLDEISSGDFQFGLGFAIGAEGEYSWGGAAGTRFWINPKRKLIGLFMIQIKPYGLKYGERIKQVVYAADLGTR
ncbi:MAG: serine hydrolase [Planctomycetota bacterium]|nr:serine hydrolase [Planctomycetota bacterium]